MRHLFLTLCATLLLGACATKTNNFGHSADDVAFKVDGQKTVYLPITDSGPVFSKQDGYVVMAAGMTPSLQKGMTDQSTFNWGFTLAAEKNAALDYIIVEQVSEQGDLLPLITDTKPIGSESQWTGKSAEIAMTQEISPWLYAKGKSTFLFKLTIKPSAANPVVLYQPVVISGGVKVLYRHIMSTKD